jgi:hypothetical protein
VPDQVSKRFKTHGFREHPYYGIWKQMMRRCHNSKDKNYKHSGGRGIFVAQDRHEIENFIRDMGKRPDGFTLERLDNNRGYSKDNCKWAPWSDQCRNRRNSKLYKVGGVVKNLSDWAKDLGCRASTIKIRLSSGWSIQDAMTKPVRNQFINKA